jgi:catechol 2,3-dioxygenase-like lactoylglutathione lyase family enzyme
MDNTPISNRRAVESVAAGTLDMKIEVIVIPVSDAARAKRFYGDLGWRLDLDFQTCSDYCVSQLTPPGSACSVIFGENVSAAAPGSTQGDRCWVERPAAREEPRPLRLADARGTGHNGESVNGDWTARSMESSLPRPFRRL